MIDKDLKEIKFEGKTIYYKHQLEESGGEMWFSTNFYFTNDFSTFRKKWFGLWGPHEPVPANKVMFNLRDEFESPRRLKEDNQKFLSRQLKLTERKEEIKRGELI